MINRCDLVRHCPNLRRVRLHRLHCLAQMDRAVEAC